jgi:hypothetical protein
LSDRMYSLFTISNIREPPLRAVANLNDTGQVSGGARRDRTDDLLNANQALSQLSYGPFEITPDDGGPGTTRTSDLTLIRGAL